MRGGVTWPQFSPFAALLAFFFSDRPQFFLPIYISTLFMALNLSIQDWILINRYILSLLLWSKNKNEIFRTWLFTSLPETWRRMSEIISFSPRVKFWWASWGIQCVTHFMFIFKFSLQRQKARLVAQHELNNCYGMWAQKRRKKKKPKTNKTHTWSRVFTQGE